MTEPQLHKRALITGITGQDGAYLARLLIKKGYQVFGARRPSASSDAWRLREMGILNRIQFVSFELLGDMHSMLAAIRPDEVYNLAASSFVPVSFEQPAAVGNVNGLGVVRILEALRSYDEAIRFYQASSSEMFGTIGPEGVPHDEHTLMLPQNPYGAAKLYAHQMVRIYRETYGLHASAGICFNHESPYRGSEFVTRKISLGFAHLSLDPKNAPPVELGNIDAVRDWGHAEDYVNAMWLMLQQSEPDDYVIATGEEHSVMDFCDEAARAIGAELEWAGRGRDLTGISIDDGRTAVKIHPSLSRPLDVQRLRGDASKAHRRLGWSPGYSFRLLVAQMVQHDIERLRRSGYG